MKKICILFLLMFFVITHFAYALTLQEAKDFFENAPKHRSPPTEYNPNGYIESEVDIVKFWQEARIEPSVLQEWDNSYLFGCKPEAESCEFSNPKVKEYFNENVGILRINRPLSSDYQYFFFAKDGENWNYFDHIDIINDNYAEPELKFFDKNLFKVRTTGYSGTNLIEYVALFYTIDNGKLKSLLLCPEEYHRNSWGWMYTRDTTSKFTYKDNTLTLDYNISFGTNPFYTEPYTEEFSLFSVPKRVLFDWDGKSLIINQELSQLSLDELSSLNDEGYKEVYSLFKAEFDSLENGSEQEKEWFENFKSRLEETNLE